MNLWPKHFAHSVNQRDKISVTPLNCHYHSAISLREVGYYMMSTFTSLYTFRPTINSRDRSHWCRLSTKRQRSIPYRQSVNSQHRKIATKRRRTTKRQLLHHVASSKQARYGVHIGVPSWLANTPVGLRACSRTPDQVEAWAGRPHTAGLAPHCSLARILSVLDYSDIANIPRAEGRGW